MLRGCVTARRIGSHWSRQPRRRCDEINALSSALRRSSCNASPETIGLLLVTSSTRGAEVFRLFLRPQGSKTSIGLALSFPALCFLASAYAPHMGVKWRSFETWDGHSKSSRSRSSVRSPEVDIEGFVIPQMTNSRYRHSRAFDT